jgi:hypothetical protein
MLLLLLRHLLKILIRPVRSVFLRMQHGGDVSGVSSHRNVTAI